METPARPEEDSPGCIRKRLRRSRPPAPICHDDLTGMAESVDQPRLDAAEGALATNLSTFAILPINEMVAEDGLLSRLEMMGYEIREP